jgi:hypothetical protein
MSKDKEGAMRALLLVLGFIAASAGAAEPGRYQAIALDDEAGLRGGSARVLIIDTADGHVWTWSGNELMPDAGSGRRYGAAFVYQGKLRPGNKPGEIIDAQPR